jgi:hypothetical protein
MQIRLGIVYKKSGGKSVSLSVGLMVINNATICADVHHTRTYKFCAFINKLTNTNTTILTCRNLYNENYVPNKSVN